jgi:hypothetical protein
MVVGFRVQHQIVVSTNHPNSLVDNTIFYKSFFVQDPLPCHCHNHITITTFYFVYIVHIAQEISIIHYNNFQIIVHYNTKTY